MITATAMTDAGMSRYTDDIEGKVQVEKIPSRLVRLKRYILKRRDRPQVESLVTGGSKTTVTAAGKSSYIDDTERIKREMLARKWGLSDEEAL